MVRKNPQNFVTIAVKREEWEKLKLIKTHPNQPFWEIIKELTKDLESPVLVKGLTDDVVSQQEVYDEQ